mmetsp:Transcript_25741/g.28832  ORF Transcript_25741/g.28832 Transcript_25741/m.28832 type:complete len:634 (-) Transcript_25741:373-2274(-)
MEVYNSRINFNRQIIRRARRNNGRINRIWQIAGLLVLLSHQLFRQIDKEIYRNFPFFPKANKNGTAKVEDLLQLNEMDSLVPMPSDLEITKSTVAKIEFNPDAFNFTKDWRSATSGESATSRVSIDAGEEYVFKQIIQGKYWEFGVLDREVCIVKQLSNFSWAPKLVWYNSSSLATTYVGKQMTKFTIPLNYKEQIEKIFFDMESVGINHGDIYKPCNVQPRKLHFKCMKDPENEMYDNYEFMLKSESGKIYSRLSLVDFGWATKNGNYSCEEHIPNKKPQYYEGDNDRSYVLPKLDETFRRHLRVEQHFMVDWTLGYTEKKIRETIKKWPNLLIRKMVQHPLYTDNKERVEVFSKFYSTKVDDFRGKTAFNMYFLYDRDPKYDFRPSSKGKRLVNTAMFDLKKALRLGLGGFLIHATDNIQETKENMVALGIPQEYQHRQFDTLRRVFDVLNFFGMGYVVLRNFERMPDDVRVDPSHLNVDLLVSNYYEAKRLLDSISPASVWKTSYENGKYRVVNSVMIDGTLVNFDIRSVGDNYFDRQWQLDVLKRRSKLRGLYVPSKEDHLHSLIYHAIIQKPRISETYVEVFKELRSNWTDAQVRDKKFLAEKLHAFMEEHGYKMVKPNDITVGYFTN